MFQRHFHYMLRQSYLHHYFPVLFEHLTMGLLLYLGSGVMYPHGFHNLLLSPAIFANMALAIPVKSSFSGMTASDCVTIFSVRWNFDSISNNFSPSIVPTSDSFYHHHKLYFQEFDILRRFQQQEFHGIWLLFWWQVRCQRAPLHL